MELGVSQTVEWMVNLNDKIQGHKDELSALDRAIGDGDHGINMARGFQEVENALKEQEFSSVSDVLKKVATTVMSKVGGASGPLYGTAFLKMSMACKDKRVDDAVFVEMLEAAVEGVMQRGKAVEGEKTMVDVWLPVCRELKSSGEVDGARLKEVAYASMEATKDKVATKGRAAYLKERSQGHIDPGAVSSYYLFEALVEVLDGS